MTKGVSWSLMTKSVTAFLKFEKEQPFRTLPNFGREATNGRLLVCSCCLGQKKSRFAKVLKEQSGSTWRSNNHGVARQPKQYCAKWCTIQSNSKMHACDAQWILCALARINFPNARGWYVSKGPRDLFDRNESANLVYFHISRFRSEICGFTRLTPKRRYHRFFAPATTTAFEINRTGGTSSFLGSVSIFDSTNLEIESSGLGSEIPAKNFGIIV